MTLDEKMQSANRLHAAIHTCCTKKPTCYYEPFSAENTFMQHALHFLQLLSPYAMYDRSDAGTKGGRPDIVVCFCGQYIGLELKDNTGKASPQQNAFASRVIAAGGICATVTTIEQIAATLLACL